MNIIFKCLLVITIVLSPSLLFGETIKIATINWCPYVCLSNDSSQGLLVEYVEKIFSNAGSMSST